MGLLSLFKRPKERREELKLMVRRINTPTRNYHREILDTFYKSRMAKMYKKEWIDIRNSQKDHHMLTYFIPKEDIKKLAEKSKMDEFEIKNRLLAPQTVSNLEKVLGDRAVLIEGVGDLGLLLAIEIRPNERTKDIAEMIKKADIDNMIKSKLRSVLKRPMTESEAREIISKIETRRPPIVTKMMETTEKAARNKFPRKTGMDSGKIRGVWYIRRVRKPV